MARHQPNGSTRSEATARETLWERHSSWLRFLTAVIAVLFAGVAIGFSLALPAQTPSVSTVFVGGTVGVLSVLATAGALLVVIPYLNRIRYRDIRIALTGQQGAGKTVFSVALFDVLMSGESGARFTAESRTVLEVFQTLRGISEGRWPPSTKLDRVTRYEGRVQYGRSRLAVDLELGDSAGEYWAEFSDDGTRNPDYANYVVSAEALAHVIAADRLKEEAASGRSGYSIARDEADLQLAARLRRAAWGHDQKAGLLIVVSKIDLLNIEPSLDSRIRFVVFPAHHPFVHNVLPEIVGDTAAFLLESMMERLEADFTQVSLTFSSALPPKLPIRSEEGISGWVRGVAGVQAKYERRAEWNATATAFGLSPAEGNARASRPDRRSFGRKQGNS